MDRLEKNKKKALLIFGLLFLVFGGGASVFFIFTGIEDLKSFDKESNFHYSFNFKKAALPFFEYLGFTDGEDVREKSVVKFVGDEDFDEAQSAASADKKYSANSRIKSGAFNRRRPRVPKMYSKNRGLEIGKGARSKSSLVKSKFSKSDAEKDVNITKTGFASKKKSASAGAYGAMRKTGNLLAQTHKTNSALGIRSKWDKSFIGGGAVQGNMSYKGKAVELDEVAPSVLNLKENNKKTLSVPEVGAPKKDEAAEAKIPALKKLKDAANPMEGLLNQMFGNVAGAAGNTIGSGEDVQEVSPEAVDYAKGFTANGENANVSIVSCDTDETFCADNNISGSYYKASYDGCGNWSAVDMAFVSEEGGMREIGWSNP